MLLALGLPTSGVLRGLDALRRHAIIGGSPLQKARKAGALCEVVRTKDWEILFRESDSSTPQTSTTWQKLR